MLNALASSIRGTGNMLVPSAAVCVGVVLLIPLSPLLIFGYGPVPLAPSGQEGWSVPDVLAWNTALRRLEWTNHQGLVGLAEHLDVATALSSASLLGLEGAVTGIIEILSALASPGFILIGSVGFIVMALAAYYVLLFTVAKLLLFYVCLPSLGLAAVCGVVKQLRLQRFEEAVLAAARRAIQHLFDQEGRPCWSR